MEYQNVKLCPYCEKGIPAEATRCRYCGHTLVRPATVLESHKARTSAKNKQRARKLFWLGLITIFVGCFHTTSADPTYSGDLFQAGIYAFGAAAFNYLTGLIPAAVNSLSPLFLGDNVTAPAKVLIFGGAALLIWGCRLFAQDKALHHLWGYLGFFGFAGVIVLMLLPERQKSGFAPYDGVQWKS